MSVTLDKDAFFARMKKLYAAWKSAAADAKSEDALAKVDCIISCVGDDEETLYSKSTAFQTWLFGYELPDTITVLTEDAMCFLANKKRIDFLKPIVSATEDSDLPPAKLLVRDRTDKDKENFNKLIQEMKRSKNGKAIGLFIKDNYPGEFCESWATALDAEEFEEVDVSSSFAYLMATKDDSEIITVIKACLVTVDVFAKYLKDQILEIIDSDKKVKHSELAEGVETAIFDKKYLTGVDASTVDLCYPAIIQSGGHYNLKFCAVSDENHLHFGAIVCSLGARYKHYCSNIVRTLLVNPSEEIQGNYNFLLNLEEEIRKKLVAGAKLSAVYEAGLELVKKKRPDLVDHLTKTFGFAMGIEFRESSIVIRLKTNVVAKKGMVFNIHIGLSNLTNSAATDEEGKTYALFIGDTVLVNEEQPASLLTQSEKKIMNIGIFLKDDGEDEKENKTEILGTFPIGEAPQTTQTNSLFAAIKPAFGATYTAGTFPIGGAPQTTQTNSLFAAIKPAFGATSTGGTFPIGEAPQTTQTNSLFGASKPAFGATSTPGTFPIGEAPQTTQTNSLFGASKPAFGATSTGGTFPIGEAPQTTQTNSLFGAIKPAFGATSTAGTFPFGEAPQTTQTNFLFGASKPAFGATSTAGTFPIGGAPQTTQTNYLFGASKPDFGATSTAVLGAPATTSGTTGFGFPFTFEAPATSSGQSRRSQKSRQRRLSTTSTAGGSGQQQAGTGTAHVKYKPVVGNEKIGLELINLKHHFITCMKEYQNKSIEELRLEDYTAGRRGCFSLFSPALLFGGSALGAPAATSAPSVFGGGTLGGNIRFGQSSTISFGGAPQATQTNSLFAASKPAFGTTSTAGTGLFVATTTQQTPSFGTTTSTFGGFGSNRQKQASTALYGAEPVTTGFREAPSFSFGSGGGLVGAKPATTTATAFGSTAPGGGLGSNTFQAEPAASTSGSLGGASLFQEPQRNTSETAPQTLKIDLPPLQFNNAFGIDDDSRITADGTMAVCRRYNYNVISRRRVMVNEKVCFKIVNELLTGIHVGFAASSSDQTLSKCWEEPLNTIYCKKNNIVYYYFNAAGEVFYGVNNEEKGLLITGVDVSMELWALMIIEGIGATIQLVDPSKQLIEKTEENNNRISSPSEQTQSHEDVASRLVRIDEVGFPCDPIATICNEVDTAIQFEDASNMQIMRPTQSPREEIIGGLQYLSIQEPLPQLTDQSPLVPLSLHATKGWNICLRSEFAIRLARTFNQGYVFTAHPVPLSQTIVIKIVSVQARPDGKPGGLAYGFTSCDPATLKRSDLPNDTEQLIDRPEYWVVRPYVAKDLHEGDELAITLSVDGEIQESRNYSEPITVMHVDHTLKLWAFVDLYESTHRVQMLGTGTAENILTRLRRLKVCNALRSRSIETDGMVAKTELNAVASTSTAAQVPILTSLATIQDPFQDIRAGSDQDMTRIFEPSTSLATIQDVGAGSAHVMTRISEPSTSQNRNTKNRSPVNEGPNLTDKECSICFNQEIDSAVYKCGHMCMCYTCALRVWKDGDGRCPICRTMIVEVIRIYRS